MSIQCNSSDHTKAQHICCQCCEPMHGAGFGCGHEYGYVLDKLDTSRLSANAKAIKNITSETICLKCYEILTNFAIELDDGDDNDDDDGDDDDGNDDDGDDDDDDDKPSCGKNSDTTEQAADKILPTKRRANGDAVKKKTKKNKGSSSSSEGKLRKEFTVTEKLNILSEYRKKTSSRAGIISKYNCSKSSLSRWKKMESQLKEELAKSRGGGATKRLNSNDGLCRVKNGLLNFYELNESMPKALKIPITREIDACHFHL